MVSWSNSASFASHFRASAASNAIADRVSSLGSANVDAAPFLGHLWCSAVDRRADSMDAGATSADLHDCCRSLYAARCPSSGSVRASWPAALHCLLPLSDAGLADVQADSQSSMLDAHRHVHFVLSLHCCK